MNLPDTMGLSDEDALMNASRRSLRRKMIGAIAIAVVSTAATFMSCVGQSFSYRQARALEAIGHAIEQGCKK